MAFSYQKRYYSNFHDPSGRNHKVELHKYSEDVITAEEVDMMSEPFTIELPSIDHKFQVVRGTGCTISLLSATDQKFLSDANGLYFTGAKDFMVKHYIDEVINWLGYLNSEMYRESYDQTINYPISVTGNDGFALMERYHFVDGSGNNYTGIKSKYEILGIIFDKIGLPFTELRICLATTSTYVTIGDETTLLHGSYQNCANFYDEDGTPFTLRKVLEGILAPYGAFITQSGGNIYIADIHSLASDTLSYKCFLCSDWTYSQTVSVTDNIKDVSAIGYKGTGQEKEISGGKNKQVISYSPYPLKLVVPEVLKELNEFSGVPESYSTKNGYYYMTLTGNSTLTETSPATFEASYNTNSNDAIAYLRWARQASPQKVCELTVSPTVIASAGDPKIGPRMGMYSGLAFLITGDILPVTKSNPYATEVAGKNVVSITLFIKICVGDKYYTQEGREYNWYADSTRFMEMKAFKSDNSSIADIWTPMGYTTYPDKITVGGGVIIPIYNMTDPGGTADLSGDFKFEIWSQWEHSPSTGGVITNSTDILEIWIKNLSIRLVDRETLKDVDDTDREYIGVLDQQFKDEAEKIELICGTDVTKADRGKIMYADSGNYAPIKTWTRDSQTYTIEELLLNSLSSNFRAGYRKLNGMVLNNSFNQLNVITDTGFTSGVKFMVASLRNNYRDEIAECDLIEITPDELTIVK